MNTIEPEGEIVGELVDPTSLPTASDSQLLEYRTTGLLQVPGGEVATCLRMIENHLKRAGGNNRWITGQVLLLLLEIYYFYAHWKREKLRPGEQIELFMIEDEGAFASVPVKRGLGRERIKSQASALVDRYFPSQVDGPAVYRHRVARPSIGLDFGKGEGEVIFLDPTLATGGSILAILEWLETHTQTTIEPKRIKVWTLAAAPTAIDQLCQRGITVVTAKQAAGINQRGYIVDQNDRPWVGNMAEFLAKAYLPYQRT